MTTITTPHWGWGASVQGETRQGGAKLPEMWPRATSSAVGRAKKEAWYKQEMLPSAGLPQFGPTMNDDTPECASEETCRQHCREVIRDRKHFMLILYTVFGSLSVFAFIGVFGTCWRRLFRRKREALDYERRYGENAPSDSSMSDTTSILSVDTNASRPRRHGFFGLPIDGGSFMSASPSSQRDRAQDRAAWRESLMQDSDLEIMAHQFKTWLTGKGGTKKASSDRLELSDLPPVKKPPVTQHYSHHHRRTRSAGSADLIGRNGIGIDPTDKGKTFDRGSVRVRDFGKVQLHVPSTVHERPTPSDQSSVTADASAVAKLDKGSLRGRRPPSLPEQGSVRGKASGKARLPSTSEEKEEKGKDE